MSTDLDSESMTSFSFSEKYIYSIYFKELSECRCRSVSKNDNKRKELNYYDQIFEIPDVLNKYFQKNLECSCNVLEVTYRTGRTNLSRIEFIRIRMNK